LKRGYVVADWIFRRVDLWKSCTEKKDIFHELVKREEIWIVGSREDTWQRSTSFGGRVL
jgi:hypothetical protein